MISSRQEIQTEVGAIGRCCHGDTTGDDPFKTVSGKGIYRHHGVLTAVINKSPPGWPCNRHVEIFNLSNYDFADELKYAELDNGIRESRRSRRYSPLE